MEFKGLFNHKTPVVSPVFLSRCSKSLPLARQNKRMKETLLLDDETSHPSLSLAESLPIAGPYLDSKSAKRSLSLVTHATYSNGTSTKTVSTNEHLP